MPFLIEKKLNKKIILIKIYKKNLNFKYFKYQQKIFKIFRNKDNKYFFI